MLRNRPVRLLFCAALVGSASLAAVAVPGGIASAVAPLTVNCTGLTGTLLNTFSFSGCTGTAFALTGATGASVPLNPTHLRITWSTTHTSKVAYTATTTPPSIACPPEAGFFNIDVLHEVGTVVVGGTTTAKGMVGGVVKLKACEYATTLISPITLWVGVGPQKV